MRDVRHHCLLKSGRRNVDERAGRQHKPNAFVIEEEMEFLVRPWNGSANRPDPLVRVVERPWRNGMVCLLK